MQSFHRTVIGGKTPYPITIGSIRSESGPPECVAADPHGIMFRRQLNSTARRAAGDRDWKAMIQVGKPGRKRQQDDTRADHRPLTPDLNGNVVERDAFAVDIGDQAFLQRLSTVTDLDGEPERGDES